MTEIEINSRGLRIYSKIVCGFTALLIFVGALVKSNEAGLAVPDWPTSFGDNMFLFPPSKWVGIIFFEHVHRLLASFVGLLTVILAVWIYRREQRKWVRVGAYLAVLAVILQGLLGGLTVIYQLPLLVSSMHGVLGQCFFILTIVLAYSQSSELARRISAGVPGNRRIFKLSSIFLLLVFLQLIIGALMRHSEAGLAVPDFPLMGGEIIPRLDSTAIARLNEMRSVIHLPPVEKIQVAVHLLHRFWGFLVVAAAVWLVFRASKEAKIDEKIWAYLVAYIVVVQFALGIFAVLTIRQPLVTSLHVVTGALLLGASAMLCIKCYPAPPNQSL